VGFVLYKGNTYAISFTPQMQFADYVIGFSIGMGGSENENDIFV